MGFQIRNAEGGVTVVELSGELDHHKGSKEFYAYMDSFRPAKDMRLLIEMSGVTYICSETVGAVLNLGESVIRAGGKACCSGVRGMPKDVFEILGVESVLNLYAGEAEALKVLTA